MNKVNIKDKFQLFSAYWTPKIFGEVINTGKTVSDKTVENPEKI